ncbi:aquaporin-like protein [Xylariaceae sp. FL0804]|nr:aquaporin-like protein [Xylariaceae sp. FL0804]
MAPPPNSNHRHTRSASGVTQPWLNPSADSSNDETLNEIPLGGLQSGVADRPGRASESRSGLPRESIGLPRESIDNTSRVSGTAQRLAELRAEVRAEMKANQDQINQLTEAHRAVHNAVSGITATQELLKYGPKIPETGMSSLPARNASTRTAASKMSDFQASTDRPEQPMSQPPGMERQGYVPDDYYEHNPWYGKPKSKPVYSLGKPLPHKTRGWKKPSLAQKKKKQNGADPEKGEGGTQARPPPRKGKSVRIADDADESEGMMGQDGGARKTNDAGQPIYDHQPWDVDFKVPDLNAGQGGQNGSRKGPGYEDGSKFKVDGEPVGQKEDPEAEEPDKDPDDYRNWWARFRAKYPEPLAEFLATGMSVFLGLCATLTVNISSETSTPYGDYVSSCWAWGFAFMFGIYIGGGISGAHMNPVISIMLSIFRGFPWRQCGVYIVIQFVASMTAAALAWALFRDAILHVDPTMSFTYTSFFSFPQSFVTPVTAFFTQFVAGAVVMIVVFSLGDDQNNPPGAGMHAFVLGLLQVGLKLCLGFNTGASLNPASDFGPRVVAYAVGYRTPEIFTNSWWVYGPWAAALVGSLAGCIVYDAFIFVGSESPVNYRVPKAIQRRKQLMLQIANKD